MPAVIPGGLLVTSFGLAAYVGAEETEGVTEEDASAVSASEADRYVDVFASAHLAEWHALPDGTAVLRVRKPEGTARGTAALLCSARFGPYSAEWNQGPYDLYADMETEVSLAIPREAFLDERASEYVTEIRVIARVGGIEGHVPSVYVAWRDGLDRSPDVFTREEMPRIAPYGVLTPELQAEAATFIPSPTDRLSPTFDIPATRGALDTGTSEDE